MRLIIDSDWDTDAEQVSITEFVLQWNIASTLCKQEMRNLSVNSTDLNMAEYEGGSGINPEPWHRIPDDVGSGADSRDLVRISIESSDETEDVEQPFWIWMNSVVPNLGNSSLEYPMDVIDNNKHLSHKDTVVKISLSNKKDVSIEDSSSEFQEVVMQASSHGSVISSVDSETKKSDSETHIITGDSRQEDSPRQIPDTWQDLSAEDFADEDFHCYLLCFSCCKQRLIRKGI